jgi:hypothetical protein
MEIPENQSLNIKDLIPKESLDEYLHISKDILDKTFDEKKENRELLRQKLRNKTNILKGNRISKDLREKNQINELKKNPMFQSLNNIDNTDVNMNSMIDKMASSMTKDPKQKKNIKKQLDKLIDKMKEQNL